VSNPRDRAHVVGTAPGSNKLAAEGGGCPTSARHVCAARGLSDNTGVVVAVNINLPVGPPPCPPREPMATTCRPR
jgi:hypothetical protein